MEISIFQVYPQKVSLGCRRIALRSIASSYLLMLGISLLAYSLQAKSVIPDSAYQLMKAQTDNEFFQQKQDAFLRAREQERSQIPTYSANLSRVIYDFHHHIADMHYLDVSCKLCREYVKKIKYLSKKIDQGMK